MFDEKKKKSEEWASEEKETNEKKKESCTNTARNDDACTSESNSVFVWLVIIALVIGVIIFFVQQKDNNGKAKPVSDEVNREVSVKAMELIKGQLVGPDTEVVIGEEIIEESGLYKIELTVDGQEITAYMTKDKTKFIPQLIDIEELEALENEEGVQSVPPSAEVQTKSDKPEVEIFVMSHCPYGTQIEKGVLPVLDTLGKTVDAKFKFVDYAMHGETEVKEQLRQYCIQENEPNKFNDYLTCFLAGTVGDETEANACMTKLQINQTMVTQCEEITDTEHKVLALLEDESSWVSGQFPQFNIDQEDNEKYGVQGSPTLVINGEIVQTGRDSASLLTTICSAFNEQPEVCQTEFSSAQPAPGFGTGVDTSGESVEDSCGV